MEKNASVAYATKTKAVQDVALGIAAFGFTAAQLAAARKATISARTAGVMVTWSGAVPTAISGHPIAKDAASYDLEGNTNINALQRIVEDAAPVSSASSSSSASPASTANVTITLAGSEIA